MAFANDPNELDRFKRADFPAFAASRGYEIDKRESSRQSLVLRDPRNDDKLVARRADDGHWTYFSVRDAGDHGTIVDFCRNRGAKSLGDVRRELREWMGSPQAERSEKLPSPLGPARGARPFEDFPRPETSLYLNARGLRPETLQDPRFRDTWRIDARGNALFAHRDESGVTGYEIKGPSFTGFAAGGRRAIWGSERRPAPGELVVAESAIDALSFAQLSPGGRDRRFVSFGGAPSPTQWQLLEKEVAAVAPNGRVLSALDADAAGRLLEARLKELVRGQRPDLGFGEFGLRQERAKDWNEVLQRKEREFIRSLPAHVQALGRKGPGLER